MHTEPWSAWLEHTVEAGRRESSPTSPAAPQVLGAVPPARLATAMLTSAAGGPSGGPALSAAAARDAADEALVSRLDWLREWAEGVAEGDPDDSCRHGWGSLEGCWCSPCPDPRCWQLAPGLEAAHAAGPAPVAAPAACAICRASAQLRLPPPPCCRVVSRCSWLTRPLQDDGGWRAEAAGAPGSGGSRSPGQRPAGIPPGERLTAAAARNGR